MSLRPVPHLHCSMAKTLLVASVTSILAGGCMNAAQLEPGTGYRWTSEGHDYTDVWDAAVVATGRIAQRLQLDKSGGRITGDVLNNVGPNDYDIEEIIAVWISPPQPGAGKYTVEVQNHRYAALDLTATNWTAQIIATIQAELGAKAPR